MTRTFGTLYAHSVSWSLKMMSMCYGATVCVSGTKKGGRRRGFKRHKHWCVFEGLDIMPSHVSKGTPKEQVQSFMTEPHGIALHILLSWAKREYA